MADKATLQKYKDFSIDNYYGDPATPWNIYYHSVIEELETLDVREAQRAYDLWKRSFNSCLNVLPRTKDHLAYFWYYDTGFNIVLITENYKCGVRVIHSSSEYDYNIYSRLSYENKDEEKIDKTFTSANSFAELCNEVISLTDDEYNIFKPLLSAYKSVEDLFDLYYNHLKFEYEKNVRNVVLADGEIIWDKFSGKDKQDHWKI